MRTATEVAQRVLALMAVIDEARRDQIELMHAWVAHYGIARYFTPNETQFMAAKGRATKAVRVDFSWRAEGLMVLIFALGGLERCPPLDQPLVSIDSPLRDLAAQDPDAFLAQAQLRPAAEIEALGDALIDASTRLRLARSSQAPPPPVLDPAVVYERTNAIGWLLDDTEPWD